MAEFLTTNGTSYYIENIIMEAESALTLVSPYLQISKTFHERLKDATKRGVEVIIIYGKDELKHNERNSLAELGTIKLYYFDNLHAKCYYNEKRMVITSMNMYSFSEKTNREMGVLIDAFHDKNLYEKAVTETMSILESAKPKDIKNVVKNTTQIFNAPEVTESIVPKGPFGYCIRCEERIPLNTTKPYCGGCYTSWSKYENWDYREIVCHRCGEPEPSSMCKPQCYDCYLLTEYEKDMAVTTSSLPKKFRFLTTTFPSDKITQADNYIYFSGLLPFFDAFIKDGQVTLKHITRNAQENGVRDIHMKIKRKLPSHAVTTNQPTSTYSYWTWDIDLSKGDDRELINVLTAIKAMTL